MGGNQRGLKLGLENYLLLALGLPGREGRVCPHARARVLAGRGFSSWHPWAGGRDGAVMMRVREPMWCWEAQSLCPLFPGVRSPSPDPRLRRREQPSPKA